MVASRKQNPETQSEALDRLLRKAREEGITLLMEGESERWFATSSIMPEVIYAVSGDGCTCQGFRSFGRCKHFALYLDRFGAPSPVPSILSITPAAVTSIDLRCTRCDGRAYEPLTTLDGRTIERPCSACSGRGVASVQLSVVDLPALVAPNTIAGDQCPVCKGDGFRIVSTGTRLSDWNAEPCQRCDGHGLIPAVAIPELALAAA